MPAARERLELPGDSGMVEIAAATIQMIGAERRIEGIRRVPKRYGHHSASALTTSKVSPPSAMRSAPEEPLRLGMTAPVEVAKMTSQSGQNKGEMPVAEVVRLTELVNYQDGSVVSRTIVKRGMGTVTLFAFDEGQGLSEHTAAFDAVAHLLEGEAEITVAGQPLRTTAGHAVFLPANQPHSLKALTRFKMLLTMIRS